MWVYQYKIMRDQNHTFFMILGVTLIIAIPKNKQQVYIFGGNETEKIIILLQEILILICRNKRAPPPKNSFLMYK